MSNTPPLTGQTAVIAGGSSGIGFASGKALMELGASVTLVGRSSNRLVDAKDRLGGTTNIASLDLSDMDSTASFFKEHGPLDHLVLSAVSGASLGPFIDADNSALRETFDNKFWLYMNTLRAALAVLKENGSITMITGASAQNPVPGTTALAAVNGALEAMIGPLAVELAPRRVNAISPGVIHTEAWDRVPAEAREINFVRAAEKTPVGTIGTADQAGQAVASLISNPFLDGVILVVDGGLMLA